MNRYFPIAMLVPIVFAQVEYNHPEFNWHSFETPHFYIHYHDETEMTAREAATVAETIYPKITAFYDFELKEKTHLILIDPDDYSNGAAYYYDNKIMIWASPLDFELRGSHRWLQNVITHEFAHIVSLQKAMKAGTRIPGAYLQIMNYENEKRPDVLYGYPNTLVSYPIPGTTVPPWLAEGVAQYMYENADWDHWDTHRDMILRDRAINGNLLSFTEMNTFGKRGIGNESIYNSGFALSGFIAEKYGPDKLNEIMTELSVPFQFSIDGAIEQVLGVGGEDLYLDFKQTTEAGYHKAIEPIVAKLIEGKQIQKDGTTNVFPKWQPGKNAFAYLSNKENDFFGQTDLFLYDFEKDEDKKIMVGVKSAPAWHPNGSIIYYSKKPKFPNKDGSKFYDLYTFDLMIEKETRLTYDARAFNPVFIASDSALAYLATYDGSQDVFQFDLKTKENTQLTQLENRPLLSHLSYSKFSNALFFDITTHHYRDIGKVDLESGDVSLVLNNPNYDERNLCENSEGKVIYSTDKKGVYNLYMSNSMDMTEGFITNLPGGAFMPDISREGKILYSLYKNGAYTIAILDSVEMMDESFVGYSADEYDILKEHEAPIIAVNRSESTPYVDQFPNMFIMPKVMMDYGTIKPGIYFYSSEIINRLSIFGGVSLNKIKDVDMFFIFEFKRFYPTLFFETFYLTRNTTDQTKYQGIYDIQDNIKFRLVQFRSGLKLPLFGSLLEVSGTRQWYRAFIKQNLPSEGIEAGAAYDYFRGWALSGRWEMDLIKKRFDKSINPSKGFKTYLSFDLEQNNFIEGLNLSESGTLLEEFKPNNLGRLQIGGQFHFEIPVRKRWTVSLAGQGGWITNNEVDSFFHFYLGGLPGLKGYPFYSIQGTKTFMYEGVFRIPLFMEKHYKAKWLILQNSTLGAIFQAGDAWTDDFSIKKSMGIQWRLNGFSFYNFPTAIEVEYHQPLNQFKRIVNEKEINYGNEGRTYLKILFDF